MYLNRLHTIVYSVWCIRANVEIIGSTDYYIPCYMQCVACHLSVSVSVCVGPCLLPECIRGTYLWHFFQDSLSGGAEDGNCIARICMNADGTRDFLARLRLVTVLVLLAISLNFIASGSKFRSLSSALCIVTAVFLSDNVPPSVGCLLWFLSLLLHLISPVLEAQPEISPPVNISNLI